MEKYLGLSELTEFWKEKYLQQYIPSGGSKIKFVTGRCGSGKTALLEEIRRIGKDENYQVVSFSADDVWMNDFSFVFSEILRQCDLDRCLQGCAKTVIRNMGYDPEQLKEGESFCDYLAARGENDALSRREIRSQLKNLFLNDPLLDNNFALAMSLLTGDILGHPVLEKQNRELLFQWLGGDKTVKLSMLRALGLSASRITKLNARHMLRSLAEVLYMGGAGGLLVMIDDLEVLLNTTGNGEHHYTKMKREDTYESIRQLIDDLDSMRYCMFVFAFDRKLADDERNGLKSYQALWMRIQNEIVSPRFNRFADMVDMDRFEQELFTPQTVMEIAEQMLAQKDSQQRKLDYETAKELLEKGTAGTFGLPALIRMSLMGGLENV